MRPFLALALLFLVSCAGGGSEAPADFVTLDRGVEPLRAAFDAAAGKVRAIVLASPT